ncbi:MAG: tetratricopeptide repeat protein [Verrucomicrobia bacterium]|nr:tetratricopeptide repeat protein [Verrucomicrobiota bacterium]
MPVVACSAGTAGNDWNSLANLRTRDVLRALPEGGGSRPERLAWAAAELGDQPVTEGNLQAAERVLAELAGGDDAIAPEAAYLRARIYQLHRATPDYARAAAIYQELAERWPRSHWAQLGLVKLALLELYLLPGAAKEEDRIATAEKLLARVEEPPLRRDLQLQIGLAGIALRVPIARFLPHLVAAARFGGIGGSAREDILVQIGVLSSRCGEWAQAREFFERYLQEFPRNARAFAVRERLAEVNRHLAPEGGP